jgi:F-type H+-transporting ATPase subunit epsilon
MTMPFKFELVSPEKLLLSGDADQVVVPGVEGDFAVLPGHAPMLSTLRPGMLQVMLTGGKQARIFVRGGFADVSATSMTVLAQQAIDIDSVAKDWVANEIGAMEAALPTMADDDERYNAHSALQALRALA